MIVIAAAELARIERAAEAAYPAESCGLLVGRGTATETLTVSRVVESRNLKAAERDDRFEVDPKVRFDLMRELDGTEDRIVGHYHSHPDHPAAPSETDLSMVWEPEMIWLITAVSRGTATATTAHLPTPDGTAFTPVDMAVAER